MRLALTAAIIWDTLGGNDPESQMTIAIWVGKITHCVL